MAWRSSLASNAALEAADMSSDATARDVSRLVSRTFSSRTRASRPDSANRPRVSGVDAPRALRPSLATGFDARRVPNVARTVSRDALCAETREDATGARGVGPAKGPWNCRQSVLGQARIESPD